MLYASPTATLQIAAERAQSDTITILGRQTEMYSAQWHQAILLPATEEAVDQILFLKLFLFMAGKTLVTFCPASPHSVRSWSVSGRVSQAERLTVYPLKTADYPKRLDGWQLFDYTERRQMKPQVGKEHAGSLSVRKYIPKGCRYENKDSARVEKLFTAVSLVAAGTDCMCLVHLGCFHTGFGIDGFCRYPGAGWFHTVVGVDSLRCADLSVLAVDGSVCTPCCPARACWGCDRTDDVGHSDIPDAQRVLAPVSPKSLRRDVGTNPAIFGLQLSI